MAKKKGEAFATATRDECFASLERALERYEAADGRGQMAFAKVVGAIMDAAIDLGERDPDRLRRYLAALKMTDPCRLGTEASRARATALARLHAGGPATVLARSEGVSYSPVSYRLEDAEVRFNHGGRFTVEMVLASSLAFDIGTPASMSAPRVIHTTSGRLEVWAERAVPDAVLDVPPGFYDVVFCTFDNVRRVLVLLATTERRENDPKTDMLSATGLFDDDDDAWR